MKATKRHYLSINAWEDAEPEYEQTQPQELPEKFFDDTQDQEPYDY